MNAREQEQDPLIEPVEPREHCLQSREPINLTFTSEQEQQVLKTAFALINQGRVLTRRALMEELSKQYDKQWHNGKWNILKAVCDKHGIA